MTDQTQEQPKTGYVTRFTPVQRMEHMILIVSFLGLALTGLPQKYAETQWGLDVIKALGGIESLRILHRIFAVTLLAESIYHGGVVSYRLFVLRSRWTMLPTLRDGADVINWTLFNLGLRRKHPRMPRYNFIEKVEYLALVWGTVIMAITGFMLWNPVVTSDVLPGSYIPVALKAHSSEALLAFLSILIWHMYHVLMRGYFNRSMFTGKMSRELMEHEHALELEAMDEGKISPPPTPEEIKKRNRVFIPYATVMTIILVGFLVRFVTIETTAIETVPRVVIDPDAPLNVSADSGSAEVGAALWQTLPCASCHGVNAEGAPGALNVALAGTTMDFERFALRVRSGPADMPAFPREQVSDQDLADLYAWLQSLSAPE